jgi:ribonuclease-3
MHPEQIQRAQDLLDHEFSDVALLKRALTHASLVDSRLDSNERLEFLGDAVLGMVICDYLFRTFGKAMEGEMTKIKSRVVSRHVCADVARDQGLDELLRFSKGMEGPSAELPRSIIAAVYESLIGALYIDGGLVVAARFILSGMTPRIHDAYKSGHQSNFKSVLQQVTQQTMGLTPLYLVLDEKGPDHAKCFEVCVEVGAQRFDSNWGPSKKQAEQAAARTALLSMGYAEEDEDGHILLVDPESVSS